MAPAAGVDCCLEEAAALVQSRDFLTAKCVTPELQFINDHDFHFASPEPSPFASNHRVFGRLYRSGLDWRERPAVILIHGWNDAPNHFLRFPGLARQFNRVGLNALTFELPYHFQRRPGREAGVARDFLCANIRRTAEAAAQAVAEIGALTHWLRAQGCPHLGLFGISLGGWLGGLAVCHEPHLDAAVLVVPVSRLDRMIQEAAFCQSLAAAINGRPVAFGRLNLLASPPLVAKEKILLIEAAYDLFVPAETVEELAQAWGGPEVWRRRVGHVTVLALPGLTGRIVKWMAAQLREPAAKHTSSCQDNTSAADPPLSSNPHGSS
jgi:dienelactone hydrolase